MNILHTEASMGWGGQEIRILNEARGLIGRGHRVQILAAQGARILEEAPRFGVPAAAARIGRKNWRGLVEIRQWLRREHARDPIDVINTHSSTDTWLVALAGLSLRRAPPLVRTRHISAAVPNNLATRWLYGKASSLVVTTGEALREQLIQENHLEAGRVVSIPTGVDLTRFRVPDARERAAARSRLGATEDLFVLAIVATLRSWKGHRYLIDAIGALLGANATPKSPLRLLVVGDGPQRASLEVQVAARGLEAHVVFAGNQDDVVPWMHAADAFCLPSYANEGVPQALLQAMACGLPAITTSAGAISEVAVDGATALIVPMRDAGALAQAIEKLRGDAVLRERLGKAARDLVVERHTLEGMLSRMEGVFERVCTAPVAS